VIISYGLLQRESDILKTVQWHTIVADEAQALKNPLTKRTKAAIALKGDFKMITPAPPLKMTSPSYGAYFVLLTLVYLAI